MKNILKTLIVLSLMMATISAEANIFRKNRNEEYLQQTKIKAFFWQGTKTFRIKKNVNKTLQPEKVKARDYQMVGVTLYAKSRHGFGQATLIVGGDRDSRSVRKSPNGTWGGYDVDTMRVIEWDLSDNPAEANEGVWQLKFDGLLKIAHVEIHLRSKMETVRMPLGNQRLGTHANSETDRIKIKRMLRDNGYRPRDYKLKAVRVLAKSRGGHGKARLFIGQNSKGLKNVAKSTIGGFQNNGPRSFNRLDWLGLNESAQGNLWQVRFKGNNKGKRLVVVLKPIQ